MNGYKVFYRTQSAEIPADSSYEAQRKAAQLFGVKKCHLISVVLCEKGDKVVTHSGAEI
jgi:hypothetical protein